MKTQAKFTYDQVRYDRVNEPHLVVSLTAPSTDWEKERAPVCIMPVIDVSGSMNGEPLDYAKKSALKLVDHLSSDDYAGLVVFASSVELVSAPLQMTSENKEALRKKIGNLQARDLTNFSGGMLMALQEVDKADLPQGVLKRVIMLTDGRANQGVATDAQGLMPLLEKQRGNVSVSCFGYGTGADQELLADLSKIGKGNYAFIENPDDALSAFAKELGGLLSTYAQNLQVKLEALNGHEIQKVLSDVDAQGDEKNVTVSLAEILSEETINVVVKMKLSKQSKSLPRALNVCELEVSYEMVSPDGEVTSQKEKMKAKIKFVKAGQEQSKPDPKLDRIVANAEVIDAQTRAEELAKQGKYDDATLFLGTLSKELQSRGLEDYAVLTNKLGTRVSSAQTYAASASYLNSTKSAMTRGVGTSSMSADALNDLREISDFDADNSAQRRMRKKFNEPDSRAQPKSAPKAQPELPPQKSASDNNKSISRSRKRW